MKIVQISTGSSGGAGIAARHLSRLLNSAGVESNLITRDSLSLFRPKLINIKSITGKFFTFYQKSILAKDFDLVTPISIGQDVMRTITSFKPDIVHIHNWYNLLSINQIASIGRDFPIVFTLHDERLFTGGCHITLGCGKFLSGCRECPAVSRNKKLISRSYLKLFEAFEAIERFGVLAPSDWLIERAKLAPVLRNAIDFEAIPNVASMKSSVSLIQKSDNYQEGLKLVFIAADLSAKVKNLRVAMDAVDLYSKVSKFNRITFTIVGQNFPKDLLRYRDFKIIHRPYVGNSDLQKIFSDSQVLVISSQSENSPNIVSEAQLNEVIVIASSVGGIPELIRDGETGFLAECSPEGIASALTRHEFSQKIDGIRRLAREEAERRSDGAIILRRHLDFYKKVSGS
jgi:glycosyltransferase involved in cell wall biosynthesis